MSRQDITSLLDRYARGETTAEENRQIADWLADHNNPDNKWESMDASSREQWLSNVFADVESTIGHEAPVITMRLQRTWWRAAAAVAAIVVICFGLQYWFSSPKLTAIQTAANQKRSVTLSDGSTVWLNAGSELKYPEKFNAKTREVFLVGEAYFDIKHDDSKAFIVHTGNVITTVLGTAFDIKAGKKDNLVVVTVTRGKVGVTDGKRLLGIITPNQQISFNTLSKQHIQSQIDASEVIAWQTSEMRFEDITFADAAKSLSERFNVTISFSNDKIKECRFSGAALSGKNIDQVLKVICAFNNATYRHNPDGSIMIDGKGCN